MQHFVNLSSPYFQTFFSFFVRLGRHFLFSMSFLVLFIDVIFGFFNFAMLGRVLLSWIPSVSHHPVAVFVRDVTEPLLAFVKKFVPPFGMFDLSPMIVLIALQFLRNILLLFLASL